VIAEGEFGAKSLFRPAGIGRHVDEGPHWHPWTDWPPISLPRAADIALHCNGKLDEMRLVAQAAGPCPRPPGRYERGLHRVNRDPEFDGRELADELAN